jgi:RNA polymerase sigma-70 factor (ECF subfamily)
VARNQAIDFLRRRRREQPLGEVEPDANEQRLEADLRARALEQAAEARLIVERFRRDHLPPKWHRVFQARFVEQLSQREAAAELGISRTTLVYQELQVRRLLRRFLLAKEQR